MIKDGPGRPATRATSSTANRTTCGGDPNAKTPGRPTETRPAGWNSAAVLQPTLNEGNAMQPTDQTAVSDNARRADRKVALHSKHATVVHAVHLNEGSRS